MATPDAATKAKLEAANEERRKQSTDPPADASATTPPSDPETPAGRGLTKYRVLAPQGEGEGTEYDAFKVVVTKIEARSPDAAIEIAQERAPDLKDGPGLVAVPESSWHEFKRASKFERVK